jgi:NADPH:quinone reductase-like Zn-dependent oxidoreductase
MGFEGSGIVRTVGSGVQRLSVGDRVMYLGDGCYTTHKTLEETLCVKMGDSMSFVEGAAVPCVYATAAFALTDKANLQRGQVSADVSRSTQHENNRADMCLPIIQTILIHAACGGVGLAAIQIAQMIGAEVSTGLYHAMVIDIFHADVQTTIK